MKKIVSAITYYLFLSLFLIGPSIYGNSNPLDLEVTFRGKALAIEEALSLYIQHESESGNEKNAGEWLKELCFENGLFIKQMGEENGNYNFAASLYPLSSQLPNIIFLNHIDVVPPKELSEWRFTPYSGTIADGEVWGRGAYDNKGMAMMQLYALMELMAKNEAEQLPFNVTFLAVSSEETQGAGGVQYVVDNYLEELNPEVVIGEGASGLIDVLDTPEKIPVFGISLVHKKALWLQLELEIETSGHGSITPEHYANKEMNEALFNIINKKRKFIYNDLNVDFLKQMSGLYKGSKKMAMKHPRLFKAFLVPKIRKQPPLFSLFSNTVTLTSVESSSHTINAIPSKVTATLDCRLLPEQSAELFLEDLKKQIDNEAVKISVLESMPTVIPSNKESLYYQNFEKAIKQVYPESHVVSTLLPNFNDSGAFRAKGVPAYSIIPVILEKKYLESLHNVNERCPIAILDRGKEAYMRFVINMVEGNR